MFNGSIMFNIISLFLVSSASMVVIVNHAVFSLLFLVLCFIFASFLLIFLECEFLALMFLIIYVGAIAVLFLFVVMMLNSKKANLVRSSITYLPAGLLISSGCLILLVNPSFFPIKTQKWESISILNINWYNLLDAALDIEVYGQVLYTYFVLELLVAGLILLVVIIGVVYFTNIYNSKQTMDQSTFKQLSISSNYFLI